jgi:ubiquitin-protein ligase
MPNKIKLIRKLINKFTEPQLQIHIKNNDNNENILENISWITNRHSESLQIISECLPSNYTDIDELELFDKLDKKGIIGEVLIDNFVSRNLLFYPDKVFLLLELVKAATDNDLNATRNRSVYTPKSSLDIKLIDSIISSTVTKLRTLMQKNNNTDIDIVESVGFDAYKLIKYTLYQTQNIDIKPSTLISSKDFTNSVNKNIYYQTKSNKKYHSNMIVPSMSVIPNTCLYEIIYPQHNTVMESNFFFHGSPFYNWYSILNNGLYVPQSHQILHGSAHGVGIYLAKNASTSLGYLNNYKGKCIMGVAQVNNPEKYIKANGIAVVTKSEDVRLKYIIVFDNNGTQSGITYQANYLTTKLMEFAEKNKNENIGHIYNKICIKRINKELKVFTSIKEIYNFPVQINFNEKEINIWTIHIFTPNDKWGEMIWEIRFDNDYPIKPPFIRIVKPQFKYLSGHITVGGAFCNPVLTNQKWMASISIPTLLEMLLVNMEEGGAQLDKHKKTKYSLDAAQRAYKRYKVAHGWD